MRHSRTEARVGTSTRLLALGLCLALAAGCARAPRPRADVPTDTTRTGTRSGAGTATKRSAGAGNGGAAQAGVPGVSSGSSTSQPVVVPQLSAAEQARLERETVASMESAQKALDGIDVAKLDAEMNRKYVIAKDFLTQAGEARTRREFERAQGLAQKARLLAEELAPR